MKKIVLMSMSLILLYTLSAYAAYGVWIDNKFIDEGTAMDVYLDELEGGELEVALRSDGDVRHAEISLDGGRQWVAMKKNPLDHVKDFREEFYYHFAAHQDDAFILVFLIEDIKKTVHTYAPGITIFCHGQRPSHQLIDLFDALENAYTTKDIETFMSFFSSAFPGWDAFRQAVINDFSNYQNLTMRHTIRKVNLVSEGGEGVVSVFWERTYETRGNLSARDKTVIDMHVVCEDDTWRIVQLGDRSFFGSSPMRENDVARGAPDLAISPDDIHIQGTQVHAVVHNRADAGVQNVRVDFYRSDIQTYVFMGEETIKKIAGKSNRDVTLQCAGLEPRTYTFLIAVDPQNAIRESNEANNSVSKVFTFHTEKKK